MENLIWKIGDITIHQIVELEAGEDIQSIIKNATPDNIRSIDWMAPNFADVNGNLKALVQTFLVDAGAYKILIDTCNGNDKNRTDVPEWGGLKTDYLDQLRSTGITENDITHVICTHLHMDHVGWNTRLESGQWVPTFPNAKYLFSREEYAYWEQMPTNEIDDDKAAFVDSILPIMEQGLEELVESDHQINDNIKLIPSPGHTPHHVSVSITSEGSSAIISGDFLHHPCQIANPEWEADPDTNPELASETRVKMLKRIVDSETLLFGSHFANPVAGKVVSDGNRYKLKL